MSLVPIHNFTLNSTGLDFCSLATTQSNWPTSNIDSPSSLNRSERIYTVEKPPMYVIGERVLRPILDKISNVFSWFSKWSILPGASAKEIVSERPLTTLFFPSEKEIIASFKNHAYTRKRYSEEPRFFNCVAKFFGGREVTKDAEIYKNALLQLDVEQFSDRLERYYSYTEWTRIVSGCTYVLHRDAKLQNGQHNIG